MSYAANRAGMRASLGAPSESSIKIRVVSLRAGTIAVDASGGTVEIGPWNDVGENPSQAGEYALAYTIVKITGLAAFTRYTATVSCDGQSEKLTWTTLPSSTTTPFSFIGTTCERLDDRNLQPSMWTKLKQLVEEAELPVLFRVHPDDIHYVDRYDVLDDSDDTGLVMTGQPETTGEAWDYAIAWASYFGLIGVDTYPRSSDRAWFFHNMPTVGIWGDHEIADNWGTSVADVNRYSDPGVFAAASEAFAMWSDAMPDPLREGQLYFGFQAGPVAISVPDKGTHVECYDAANAGDSSTRGRNGAFLTGNPSGLTDPSRTDLGYSYDVSAPHLLGFQQVYDLCAFHHDAEDAGAKFHVGAWPFVFTAPNEPYWDWWPYECDLFLVGDDLEFIPDPYFAEGWEGWAIDDAAGNGPSASISRAGSANSIKLTNNAAGGAGNEARASLTISGLQVGETYTLECRNVAGQVTVRVGSEAGDGTDLDQDINFINNGSSGSFTTYTFTASAASRVVTLMNKDITGGDTCSFSKISVRGPGGRRGGMLRLNKPLFGLCGDTHTMDVYRFTASGVYADAADGLNPSEPLFSSELWTMMLGTVCGSGARTLDTWTTTEASGLKNANKEIRSRWPVPGTTLNPKRQIGSCAHVLVHADASPARIEYRQVQLNRGGPHTVWRGYQHEDQSGHGISYDEAWQPAVSLA